MILHAHAKRPELLRHISANAAHAQDPEDFPLRVMTEGRRSLAAEETFAEIGEGKVEGTEGAEGEENAGVGGGVVDGGGDVGDSDVVGRADGDVDLVVAGACGRG